MINDVCQMVSQNGNIDFWWEKSVKEIAPNAELNVVKDDLTVGRDILDIWFDSGTSWYCTLDDQKIANLYLEGVDQFTGWFQSSLLTSVALRSIAPFK